MTRRVLVGLILVLILAGVLGWVFQRRSGPSFDLTPYNALGAGTAEETAKLLGNKGPVTIIVPEATANSPSMQGQLDSFQKVLKKSGISSITTVRFKLGTPLEMIEAGGMIPRDQLFAVLQAQPKPAAVVLFCGFPFLNQQDCNAVAQSGSKIIVASANQPTFFGLLKAHVINMAIVPKSAFASNPDNPPAAPKARSLREAFDTEFAVLTPESIDEFARKMAN